MNDQPHDKPMFDLPLRGPGGSTEPESTAHRGFDSGPDWSGERYLKKPPPRRSSRRIWLWLLLLSLAGGGAAAYYFLRPEPAMPGFEPAGLEFTELRVGGRSEPASITVTNLGKGKAMRLEAVGFEGEHREDFEVESESCTGSAVASGESCTIEVRFAPQAMGLRQARLDLSGNLAWRAPVLSLSGVGIAPRVILEPEAVAFEEQAVSGASESTLVRFLNAGTDAVEIRAIQLAGDHPADFVLEDRCAGRTFGPDERCAFRVSFRPRAAGARRAEVRIESDAPGGAPAARLSGTGQWSGPDFTPEPVRLDFGDQRIERRSPTRALELVNRSAEPRPAPPLVAPSAGSAFRLAKDDCSGTTVAPGESCRVELLFAPNAEGPARGELTVRLPGAPVHVELAGRGVAPALSLSRHQIDFGDLRLGLRGAPIRFELTNSGNAALQVGALALGGKDAAAFQVGRDPCSKRSLAPAASCGLEIDFGPTREGRHEARLTVPSDAGPEAEVVELSGRGTRSFLSVLPSELPFGSIVRGDAGSATLEISNRGTARLTVLGLQMEGPAADDYRIAGIGCRLDVGLAPGDSCTFEVQFRPTADGARPATLLIRHDGAEGRREVGMRGIGAPPLPSFAISPLQIDFGEIVAGSRTSIRTLTVRNRGRGFLEIREVSLGGPGASAFQIVAGTCEGAPRIAPDSECTVGVRFFPQSPGSARAELTVRHNAPEGRGSVALSGVAR